MSKHNDELHWHEMRNQLVQSWNRLGNQDFEELEQMHLSKRVPIHRHHTALNDERRDSQRRPG